MPKRKTKRQAQPHSKKQDKSPQQLPEQTPASIEGSWLARHSTAVSAWSAVAGAAATVVLAVFAYVSWEEVKAQRQQIYDQMRLATEPILVIRSPENFTLSEQRVSTEWKVINKGGGPVEDVSLGFVLLEIQKNLAELLPSDPIRQVVWYRRDSVIPTGDTGIQFLGVPKDDRAWVAEAMQRRDVRVWALGVAHYEVRSRLLGGEDESRTVTASFWWNPIFEKWMQTTSDGHDKIKRLAVDRGVLDPKAVKDWSLEEAP